jgi:signal transduction histidine kinase
LYSELLSRPGVLSPEHEHYAAELRGIAERGSSLMRSLIPHIRPAPDPHRTIPYRQARVPVDLSAVLRELEPLLAAIAAPNATVVLEAPQSLPFEGVPTDCLERVLINLVRNSAQAIASSQVSAFGTVRIALAAHADHLRLTVEDDGPGMSVATTSAFLSPAPLPPGATHGLGHRIVHDLVTSSGGKLTVRVRRGQGTSFTIQWPTDPLYSVDQPLSGTTASLAPSFVTGSHEVSAC